MITAVKTRKTGRKNTPEQGTLEIPGAGDTYRQEKIDGSGTAKQTTPKKVQKAADYFFSKKADFACSKSNYDKAAEDLLKVMQDEKITQAKVYDADGYPRRITVRQGAEKIKVEKDLND